MISRTIAAAAFSLVTCCLPLRAQTSSAFYFESFDSVVSPRLPAGWTATSNKALAGDFTTSSSVPLSSPNAVVTTDAKVPQCLTSPALNLTGKIPAVLQFYERRTSSHNSGLLIEAVVNNDTSSVISLSDTLKNSGTTGYVSRNLSLPSSLAGMANVRFRWRLAGNGTGATGTMRIDNVSITVEKVLDLAVSSLAVQPTPVKSGETAAAVIGVSNRGRGGTFSFSLKLSKNVDSDSTAAVDETISEESLTRDLSAAESTIVVVPLPAFSPGAHRFTVVLHLPGDEDTTNNALSISILAGSPRRSVIINEIMYAPTTGPEWVECINNSQDTIPLLQWKIGDNTTSRATITSAQLKILPRQFFIIARDSSLAGIFPSLKVPLIKASFPTLNNDGDAVVIIDPTGCTIDSVAYAPSWGGTEGTSLERIDTAGPSNSPANWASSRDPMGATPGLVNSVSPKEFDAAVTRASISTTTPRVNEPITVSAVVKNVGRNTLHGISVSFTKDWESAPEPPESRGIIPLALLSPSDSTTVTQSMVVPVQGDHRITITVHALEDDDAANNSAALSFTAGVKPSSVVVNEIMYAPPGDMPEWIEFYNAGSIAVDVAKWKISDSNVKTRTLVANASLLIPPGAFLVVSADSSLRNYCAVPSPLAVASFSALNNTTPDAVVLYDNRGITIDSVWYVPAWGGTNGRSLERVDYFSSSLDSANWRSSMPTPGIENSVAKKDVDIEVTGVDGSPMQNGMRLTAAIQNVGRKAVQAYDVKFFRDLNCDSVAAADELLGTLQQTSLNAGDSTHVHFDWLAAVQGRIPIVCRAEAAGDQRISNNEKLGWATGSYPAQSVVINEIMYDPLPGWSEFVELFNRTGDTLDLQGWKMMDAASSSGSRRTFDFPAHRMPLLPGSYAVVGGDSNLVAQYPRLASDPRVAVVMALKGLSLNNSGDDIILLDLTGLCIDSVRYSPDWNNPGLKGATAGKSLERVNPSLSGNESRNWSTCVSVEGATPGERNSIYTPAIPPTSTLRLSPNPFSPDGDGFEDFLAIQYSLPSTASMIRVRCFDVRGRLVRTLANNEAAASSGVVLWDGRDDNHQPVRIGMYVILFEAFDACGGPVRTLKDVAVVARKL